MAPRRRNALAVVAAVGVLALIAACVVGGRDREPRGTSPADSVHVVASSPTPRPDANSDETAASSELLALAREHHAASAAGKQAFLEVAKDNPSLSQEKLELIEGALLRAKPAYFEAGFESARRYDLGISVEEQSDAFRLELNTPEYDGKASWSLWVDKRTGDVKPTLHGGITVRVTLSGEYRALAARLRPCYLQELNLLPDLWAGGELRIVLGSEGKPRKVAFATDPKLSTALTACLKRAVDDHAFPGRPPGSSLRLPVTFRQR